LDVYGRIRTFAGSSLSECPLRYQGQYEDSETGLYYNYHRYYDPDTGNYISQDPIRLAGNNPTLYGYVKDTNKWLDVFGLDCKKKLPTQTHHFATNKNKKYTPQMKSIANEFGLDLNEKWNKQDLPHIGRHPNKYHDFVLEGMQNAKAGAGGSQSEFLRLFDENVKQPVNLNLELLKKSGW
jgi:RHS repeat-associated protein